MSDYHVAVRVDWLDTCQEGHREWLDTDSEFGVVTVRTYGELVRENEQMVVVSGSVTSDGALGSVWSIPRGCIVRIVYLDDGGLS